MHLRYILGDFGFDKLIRSGKAVGAEGINVKSKGSSLYRQSLGVKQSVHYRKCGICAGVPQKCRRCFFRNQIVKRVFFHILVGGRIVACQMNKGFSDI